MFTKRLVLIPKVLSKVIDCFPVFSMTVIEKDARQSEKHKRENKTTTNHEQDGLRLIEASFLKS